MAEEEGHKTRRCRRVTYPESYITKYAAYTKIKCNNILRSNRIIRV